MAHHLSTNKQFMIGNGILAFAVIFIVVIFIYMSLRIAREKQLEKTYVENYTISLTKGFAGESVSVYVNDSLLWNQLITEEPVVLEVNRFADHSAVMIVNNETEIMSTFDLSEKGGNYSFIKDEDGIKQLGQSR
ncbi:hypothetical protein [Bacteroides sp. 224]|uniref:hypothetical protein n=1 Tax=Bacteroides sp. 224 TaxID=2302936 RepID=UPI0013D6ABBE|nr:hypothetical protein [Bacteroides sp. 224]NDV64283.1 hypothetical protein [Bacteroides sp. 224]